MKRILTFLSPIRFLFDFLLLPLTLSAAVWFRIVRFWGLERMNITEKMLLRAGVFPMINHYYEPFINPEIDQPQPTGLKGLQLNEDEQLELLNSFSYQPELQLIAQRSPGKNQYYFNNNTYNSGDADFLYSIIRKNKPKRIIEVGCGFSTLMIIEAIEANKKENPTNQCKLTCVEPYENEWLKDMNIDLVRLKIQDVPASLFRELDKDDILFIDSSHVVKLNGDVLHEVLHILPELNSGVWIHFHDIFIPDNYPTSWIKQYRNWTEQYLLQAFLMYNSKFNIKAALHYLFTSKHEALKKAFPQISDRTDSSPNAIWIVKN